MTFSSLNMGTTRKQRNEQPTCKDNLQSVGSTSQLECDLGDAPLDARQIQERDATKFLVLVKSIRTRLIDVDNLCEKYIVDCCRYAGLLPSDAPDKTHIITTQEKAGKGVEEYTEITIIYPLNYEWKHIKTS